jgi:hypothetical protein
MHMIKEDMGTEGTQDVLRTGLKIPHSSCCIVSTLSYRIKGSFQVKLLCVFWGTKSWAWFIWSLTGNCCSPVGKAQGELFSTSSNVIQTMWLCWQGSFSIRKVPERKREESQMMPRLQVCKEHTIPCQKFRRPSRGAWVPLAHPIFADDLLSFFLLISLSLRNIIHSHGFSVIIIPYSLPVSWSSNLRYMREMEPEEPL